MRRAGLIVPFLAYCSALFIQQIPEGEGSLTLKAGAQAEKHELENAMNVAPSGNTDENNNDYTQAIHQLMRGSGVGMQETLESSINGESNEDHLNRRRIQNDQLSEHIKHKSLREIWQKELPCECPFNKWKPVCGVDGNTYPTECFANCIGMPVFVHSDCKYVRRELWARMQAKLGNVPTDYFEDSDYANRKTLKTHPYFHKDPEPYPEEGEEDQEPAVEAVQADSHSVALANTDTQAVEAVEPPPVVLARTAEPTFNYRLPATQKLVAHQKADVEETASGILNDAQSLPLDASQTSAFKDAIDFVKALPGTLKMSNSATAVEFGYNQASDMFKSVFPNDQTNIQVSKLDRRLGHHMQQQHHEQHHETETVQPPNEAGSHSTVEWRVFNGVRVPFDTREVPNPCPQCPLGFHPVCGTDSKTYPTACFAACSNIEIASAGECESESI